MEKSVLLIFLLFAFVAMNQAVPLSETPKRKLSEDTKIERSRLLEQLTRERRRVDYYDWQQYVPRPCKNCNTLNIGNGYKNTNNVTLNGQWPNNMGLKH